MAADCSETVAGQECIDKRYVSTGRIYLYRQPRANDVFYAYDVFDNAIVACGLLCSQASIQ